jgi:uncharacterized protein with von Willebrand factor type A (vWA) domain
MIPAFQSMRIWPCQTGGYRMSAKASTKELQENIVKNMKKWQKIENATVAATGAITEKTDNSIVRLVMEIIQHDSQTHYRVQQMIIDSFENQVITLNPDELGKIWGMIESHIEMEKATVDNAEKSLEALKGKKMVIQEYLINFLKVDEEKHVMLLDALEKIKKGMYPYG